MEAIGHHFHLIGNAFEICFTLIKNMKHMTPTCKNNDWIRSRCYKNVQILFKSTHLKCTFFFLLLSEPLTRLQNLEYITNNLYARLYAQVHLSSLQRYPWWYNLKLNFFIAPSRIWFSLRYKPYKFVYELHK